VDKEIEKRTPWGTDYDGNPIYLSDEMPSEEEMEAAARDAGLFDLVMLTDDGREVIKGERFNTFHPIKNGKPDFNTVYTAEEIGCEGLFLKDSW